MDQASGADNMPLGRCKGVFAVHYYAGRVYCYRTPTIGDRLLVGEREAVDSFLEEAER